MPNWLNITRDDVVYFLTHIMAFIAAYATCMASGTNEPLFNWHCLSMGLIAAGVTQAGVSLGAKGERTKNDAADVASANTVVSTTNTTTPVKVTPVVVNPTLGETRE